MDTARAEHETATAPYAHAADRGVPSLVWRFGQDRRLDMIRQWSGLEGALAGRPDDRDAFDSERPAHGKGEPDAGRGHVVQRRFARRVEPAAAGRGARIPARRAGERPLRGAHPTGTGGADPRFR